MYIIHNLSKISYACYKSYNGLTPNHIWIAINPTKGKHANSNLGKIKTLVIKHIFIFSDSNTNWS